MWTPELQQLTTAPEKQLITNMWSAVLESRMEGQPAYRPELPHHNYNHIVHESLPEVLRLIARDGEENIPRNRRIVIGSEIVHDMWSWLALDPVEFDTAEDRTIAWARPLIGEFFESEEAEEVESGIEATSPFGSCVTPNQKKVRRADISNLGNKRINPILAKTVDIFYEEVGLAEERGENPPLWTSFLDRQAPALNSLLSVDLSVADETVQKGEGPFNKRAKRYVGMLANKHTFRQPELFKKRRVPYLWDLVPDLEKIIPYITNEAAA
jgi:hypothetical protein